MFVDSTGMQELYNGHFYLQSLQSYDQKECQGIRHFSDKLKLI